MNVKNKKIALSIFISILVIGVVSALLLYLLSDRQDLSDVKTKGDVFLYNPDFNSDIMNEEEYLIKDRSIKYSDGFGTWDIFNGKDVLTDIKIDLFLIDYINTLVAGDGEKLLGMYSQEVVKALKLSDMITEQRIYETVFTEISAREVNDDTGSYFLYEFKAEYKIMRNDGTFRNDVSSNAVKAQYLTITKRGDDCLITGVVEYAIPNSK